MNNSNDPYDSDATIDDPELPQDEREYLQSDETTAAASDDAPAVNSNIQLNATPPPTLPQYLALSSVARELYHQNKAAATPSRVPTQPAPDIPVPELSSPTSSTSLVTEEDITSTSEAIELAIVRLESRRQEAVYLAKIWTRAIDRDLNLGVSGSISEGKGVVSGKISKNTTVIGRRGRLNRLQARARIAGLVDLQELLSESLKKLRSAQEDTGLFALSGEWELGEDQLLLDQMLMEVDTAEICLAVFPLAVKGPLTA